MSIAAEVAVCFQTSINAPRGRRAAHQEIQKQSPAELTHAVLQVTLFLELLVPACSTHARKMLPRNGSSSEAVSKLPRPVTLLCWRLNWCAIALASVSKARLSILTLEKVAEEREECSGARCSAAGTESLNPAPHYRARPSGRILALSSTNSGTWTAISAADSTPALRLTAPRYLVLNR
ncbi:hypothetical protein P154DRAFT_579577 [Amniculicola lignicola CBS 123094]|uniref:Uncharacterized protein n=1 Tax=Amniculicola lignicola CBS 123094 TaxID=1392246 RepID=A0A6A5WGK8_9PLEO|nr:hypothetical protein P154DRAFT_579577 [Amniculicola lignicola CBS 123094]